MRMFWPCVTLNICRVLYNISPLIAELRWLVVLRGIGHIAQIHEWRVAFEHSRHWRLQFTAMDHEDTAVVCVRVWHRSSNCQRQHFRYEGAQTGGVFGWERYHRNASQSAHFFYQFFYLIDSLHSAGHFHYARLLCRVCPCTGCCIFHHFNWNARLSHIRSEYQSNRFEPKLFGDIDELGQWGCIDYGHFGTVHRWIVNAECKHIFLCVQNIQIRLGLLLRFSMLSQRLIARFLITF